MLAADAIGEPLLVSDLFSATQRVEISSIDSFVSGEQQSTVVFHGQGVVETRLAGDDREIFFQQFDNNATRNSLAVANQITRGDQFSPKTDVATDGSFWVVWSGRGEGDRQGVFARRFDADGEAISDQVRVNTTVGGKQGRPDIAAAADGSAVVVWDGVGDGDFDGIFAQQLSSDGERLGTETLVNGTTDDMQAFPVVAAEAGGGFVVAWSSRHQDGDDWGVFAKRFAADGTAAGSEFQVASETAGSQHLPSIDVDEAGAVVATWSSLDQDGDSWGVFARQFGADDVAGEEFQVHTESAGQQRDSAVAAADAGEFLIAWNDGQLDGSGWEVNAQAFNRDGVADGDLIIVNSSDSGVDSGHQTTPSVALNGFGNSVIAYEGNSASDRGGVFAQAYVVEVEPAMNLKPVIEPVEDQRAIVGEEVQFLIVASDPNRFDELTFSLAPGENPADTTLVDNGDNTATLSWTATPESRLTEVFFRVFVDDDGEPLGRESTQFSVEILNAAPVVDLNVEDELLLDRDESEIAVGNSGLAVTDADQTELSSATITLRSTLDVGDESLSVDTAGTSIAAEFTSESGILALTGVDSVTNYERVLQTLTYSNVAGESRTGGVRNIDVVVSDGADPSVLATAAIRVRASNTAPEIAFIRDMNLLTGSPLHIGLDGFDADGDELTYTVTSSNSALATGTIFTGNRSWKLNVESPGNNISGEMVFEFLEGQASRATDRFIELTEDGFYDGLTFHRVIDDFVIQGGDPVGNGTGGSSLPNFDDQFSVDLQHNSTGLLSMAKTSDDTNNSQFFVTEGPSRNLDGNHTIFGVLVEGEDIREAISEVPVNGASLPLDPVTITSAEVFEDNQNAVLQLKSSADFSGEAEITVRVTDGVFTTTQSFTVIVRPDTTNTNPWLADIRPMHPVIETTIDTPTTYQLESVDVEGDPVVFFGPDEAFALSGGFDARQPPADLDVSVDSSTGLMTITPSNGLTGTFEVSVGVSANATSINDFQTIQIRVG